MAEKNENENQPPELPKRGKIISKYDEENELLEVMFIPASSAQIQVMNDPTADFLLMRIPHAVAEPLLKSMNYTARKCGIDGEPARVTLESQLPPTEPGDAGP